MIKHLVFLALIFGVFTAHAQKILKDTGVKKLSVFIGSWHAAADSGSISANFTCSWSPNGKYMIADQVVDNHGTVTNNLSIYSYNASTDDYTLTVVGIPGMAPFTVPIAYKGDTLIYHNEYEDNGKKTYSRTLNVFYSTDRYRYFIQSSTDGEHWVTSGTGESKRTK
jgi:hypothetical protein